MKTLKDFVASGKVVTFTRFKYGSLYYVTDCGFEFPVPASDISGESELQPVEKAMALMKWIRKHLEFVESAKSEV
jgi:hypothetical protein